MDKQGLYLEDVFVLASEFEKAFQFGMQWQRAVMLQASGFAARRTPDGRPVRIRSRVSDPLARTCLGCEMRISRSNLTVLKLPFLDASKLYSLQLPGMLGHVGGRSFGLQHPFPGRLDVKCKTS